MFSISAIASVVVLGTASTVSAHLPVYESGGPTMETALRIPDANVSYAITAEFSSKVGRIHFYAFSVTAGHVLNFQLAVPAKSGLELFAPVIILIGPGLALPGTFTHDVLEEFEIGLKPGTGAVSLVYEGTENTREFEPFTQVNFWVRQDAEIVLPQEAVYYLAVAVPENWPADASSGYGKYLLAPGRLEQFSALDFVSIPLHWMRWHIFWGDPLLLLMSPTLASMILGTSAGWLIVRRRAPFVQNYSWAWRIGLYSGLLGATTMIGSTVNQLSLVIMNQASSFGPLDVVVIAIQSVGLVIGAVGLWMTLRLTSPGASTSPIVGLGSAASIALAALFLGSGWIVGPLLFLAGYATSFVFKGRGRDMRPFPS